MFNCSFFRSLELQFQKNTFDLKPNSEHFHVNLSDPRKQCRQFSLNDRSALAEVNAVDIILSTCITSC